MDLDRYEQTLAKTRAAALAQLVALPLAGQLHAIAAFHESAQALSRSQFGERDTTISDYHGLMMKAASQAAAHFEAMN